MIRGNHKPDVKEIDAERQNTVETRANSMFSQMTGKDIKVHVTKLVPGARRKGTAGKYIAFDPLADVEVSVNGETTKLEGVIHDLIPKVAKGERDDIAWAIPMVAAVLDEMMLMGNTIMNVTVPAAVEAAMGVLSPEEAAKVASDNAPLTTGIPGAKLRAELVWRILRLESWNTTKRPRDYPFLVCRMWKNVKLL